MFCNPPIKHYIFLLIHAPLLYNEQGGFFMFLTDVVQEMVNTGAQQLITWVTQLLPKIFLFLILLNALTSLIGRSRVERLAATLPAGALQTGLFCLGKLPLPHKQRDFPAHQPGGTFLVARYR